VVPGVLVPLALVWLLVLAVMALGVQRGIGVTSLAVIPVLVLAFAALVVQAVLLPGAGVGLDALFAPTGRRSPRPRSGPPPSARSSRCRSASAS